MTVVTVAIMSKKDCDSKRLADAIAFARSAGVPPRRTDHVDLTLDDRHLHGVVSNHIHQKHLIVSPAA
jgi:hypothetical protein